MAPDLPPDLPDDYDESEEGPEAREHEEAEQHWQRRTDELLRAIEREGDPIEQGRQAAQRLWQAYCESVWKARAERAMRVLIGLLLLLLFGCGPMLPRIEPGEDPLLIGFAEADLVVLGTPDSLLPEALLAPSQQWGSRDVWWNLRVTVDSIAKGSLNHARRVDYGLLPVWLTPPRPFRLARNQIVIQLAARWQTADLVVGQRQLLFLKRCWDCVELPSRTAQRFYASPWFAILALPPERWADLPRRS